MNIDMNRLTEQLLELLNTPSPSGDTKKAIALVRTYFEELGIECRLTNKGALIATIAGMDDSRHKTLSAHVDTLGAMVREIKSNGRLKMTQIGGFPWNAVEGEYCSIATMDERLYSGTILNEKASQHVHGPEVSSSKRDESTMEVRIDARVSSADDARALGIEVGDFIYLNPRTELSDSGYVKSRHLDDKASVACILAMAAALVENGATPPFTTNFLISNYEEVGHGATSGIPDQTFEFVAVDMAAPGQGQNSNEHKVTICAKDSSGPYDLELRRRLVKLARENDLPYAIDTYPFYGSDASAMIRAGWDIRHGLIGPGVDASHSFERTHMEALEATTKLGLAYIMEE